MRLEIPEERKKQVDEVLARMEAGESMNSACNAVGINRVTFKLTLFDMEAVSEYARALAVLAEHHADRISASIEEAKRGEIDHQIARLEVDAHKWLASKMLPRRYSDKHQHEHSGPDGQPIETVSKVTVSIVDPADE